MIEITKTGDYPTIGTFTDLYGSKCTIQNSSLATEEAVWLGVSDHFRLGEVNARMHLSLEMAAELLVVLQRFVETGSITPEE
jgi:hypothetical protein